VREGGENVETAENASSFPRSVDLFGAYLALDLETFADPNVARRGAPKITTSRDALNPFKGSIRLLTIADSADNIRSFDLRTTPTLPAEILDALTRSTLIIHNASFDLLWLFVHLGIRPPKIFCTMTASRLLEPLRATSHSLGATIERFLGIKIVKELGASDWGAMLLTQEQIVYAQNDVRHSHDLQKAQQHHLEMLGLQKVFELEMALIPIVVAMEAHGFTVDCERLKELHARADTDAALLATKLREAFGAPILNPGSPDQLLDAFKIKGVELENTNEDTLAALQDERARLILEYRSQAKLEASTKGLLKAVDNDGRIHARFNSTGSLAGRFSSKGPNLQNITRGPLRSCFVATAPDRRLVVADYSQIELRIGAYFAAESIMLEAFRAGKDLHAATAAAVLGKAEVSRADRQLAKACNFGLLYGQGAKGFRRYIATEYGIDLSLEQTTELRDKFFEQYPGLNRWHGNAWEKAENGISESCTIFGRRLVAQGDSTWDSFQVHTNYVTQGSAADVIKVAMVACDRLLPAEVHMIATVHDELVFDCPGNEAEQHSAVIKSIMADSFKELFPEVPILVEAKVCDNWAEKG
jgi:DNA polymerase-1